AKVSPMRRAWFPFVLWAAACGSDPGFIDAGMPDGGAHFADSGGPGNGDGPPTLSTGAGAGLIFESGPVRPIALSSDGSRLYVANIPDGYLEIFDVTAGGVTSRSSVAVGVDPVAVALRNDGEVWVVNQVSDSVSIVDVASDPPRVARTLLVGDEPSDVVFAGGRA